MSHKGYLRIDILDKGKQNTVWFDTNKKTNYCQAFTLVFYPQIAKVLYESKILKVFFLDFYTQNMINSTLVSPVKMEYGWNSISGLKMMRKIGLGKNIFEIPPCAHHVIFITEFVLLIKIPPFYEVNSFSRKWQAHGRISKIFILDHFSPSISGQKCYFTHIPF